MTKKKGSRNFDFLPEGLLERDHLGNPTNRSTRLAVVAILSAVTKVDGIFEKREFIELIRTIDQEFHLLDEEAEELREVADFLIRSGTRIEDFVDQLRADYDREQLEYLLTLVWRLIKADGRFMKSEEQFAQILRRRLGLPVESD